MKHLFANQKKHQKRRAKSQLKNKLKKLKKKKYTPKRATKSLSKKNKDLKKFYKPREYTHSFIQEFVSGQIGLEHNVQDFVDFSSKIIDSNCTRVYLDFRNATRIWPSSVTMLVSLIEWVNLTSSNSVRIGSSDSNTADVNAYLGHCGFYEYVKRDFTPQTGFYPPNEVVKIKQEPSVKNTRIRQQAILNLIKLHSTLSSDDIERVDCKILSEIFVNVTEHGVTANVSGWFVLAQYHKTNGIISICIADNGIGIKNSLMTGFQADNVAKIVKSQNDADYIETALTQYISGALDSSEISPKLLGLQHAVPQGKKRGKGLKYVVDTCKQLKLKLNICSHYGVIALDENGSTHYKHTLNKRCFAGTLYHIIIPARKVQDV